MMMRVDVFKKLKNFQSNKKTRHIAWFYLVYMYPLVKDVVLFPVPFDTTVSVRRLHFCFIHFFRSGTSRFFAVVGFGFLFGICYKRLVALVTGSATSRT